MRTKKFETHLQLNSNFENYDIEMKKYQKTKYRTDGVEERDEALLMMGGGEPGSVVEQAHRRPVLNNYKFIHVITFEIIIIIMNIYV